jgi:ribokinase
VVTGKIEMQSLTMNQTAFSSQQNHWHPTNQPNTNSFTKNPIQFLRFRQNDKQNLQLLRFALNPSSQVPPVVVVGSANADIYLEIDQLPKEGETISAKSGQTLAGGKGANQACCGAKLSHPTYFIGQVNC